MNTGIVAAARTPIGRLGGTLRDVPAQELGAAAIRGLLEKSGGRRALRKTGGGIPNGADQARKYGV
jgi:acetyl-CoA acetyltransferase